MTHLLAPLLSAFEMDQAALCEIGPEQTVVLLLTSSGLKDPHSSRTWMTPVPDAPADFDGLLRAAEPTVAGRVRRLA